jgi:hypothetical protein
MSINENGSATSLGLTSQNNKVKPEDLRRLRGWRMAQNKHRSIRQDKKEDGTSLYYVPSDSHPGVMYQVYKINGKWYCANCPDYKNGHDECKHIVETLYRFFGFSVIDPPSQELLERFQPTKDWYANVPRFPHVPFQYKEGPAESTRRDHAIESEDKRVATLATEAGFILDERHKPVYNSKGGRPSFTPGNIVTHTVIRQQARKSIRRFAKDSKDLTAKGALAIAPCRNTISKYASDPKTGIYMADAFQLSVHPFSTMETDVLIDSSGFSSFYVSCWRDSVYGRMNMRKGTRWFKLHIAVGRLTKAILGFVITECFGDESADIAQFTPLLDMLVARGFDLRYVVADNIYLTEDNIASARSHGCTLVGPLKPRNFLKKTGKPSNTIKAIYDFKVNNPDLNSELCRARQAVEGVFSVEKRRSNRVASIGTKEERALEAEHNGPFVYTSRQHEFMARMIRYNLAAINREEHLRDRPISLTKGSVFSHIRETVPV